MNEILGAVSGAELLKAFSHRTRLAILQELLAGSKCVTDMEELLPARQANISQHLSVLRHAMLVDYVPNGTLRCYYLCRPKLTADMPAPGGTRRSRRHSYGCRNTSRKKEYGSHRG